MTEAIKDILNTHNLHALLWNRNLTNERRKMMMSLTIEQCVALHEEGYDTVIENGKIIGFIDENEKFLAV